MTDPAYVALALVPGIGRARLEVLLGAFETPAAVFGQPLDRLARLPGMNRAAATAIRDSNPRRGERVTVRRSAGCGAAGPAG